MLLPRQLAPAAGRALRTRPSAATALGRRCNHRLPSAGSHLKALQQQVLVARLDGFEPPGFAAAALGGPAEASEMRRLGVTVQQWLQHELHCFLGRRNTALAEEAVVLPAAGAHMAGDAMAVSDCDLVILHGPALKDPHVWSGRDGFLSHLRDLPYVQEPRRVAFGEVDNLQCVVIVQLPAKLQSGGSTRGVYVRVDVGRICAVESLGSVPQQAGLRCLLAYLGGSGSKQWPRLQDLPALADSASHRRLHSVCFNRHLCLAAGPENAALSRALKSLAWANGLYPSRVRRRRGLPGLAWRLLVMDFVERGRATSSNEQCLGTEPAEVPQLLALCQHFSRLAEQRDGGGLFVAPSLGHAIHDDGGDTERQEHANDDGQSRCPSIRMPVMWDGMGASSIDVSRHLGPSGWRELDDFFRLSAADGERALPNLPVEWSQAYAFSSLDNVALQMDDSPGIPMADEG